MQKLRALHLYLGCFFAPLLLFFAISGIWQTLRIRSAFLDRLSTIHTSWQMKDGSELTSYGLKIVVILMAVSFIISVILGVVMAVKYGRNKLATYSCLTIGIVVPLLLILVKALKW